MTERFNPVLSALALSLGVRHWMAREFAEAHLRMHLPHNIAQLWAHP